MRADLHMHALDHKYYGESQPERIRLDDEDKRNIREVVDWCARDRKLDAIALTDHDMIQASHYARSYTAEAGLPIRIIPGAECEVTDPEARLGRRWVHLLCLGLEELPVYGGKTTVERMVQMVKQRGGVVIMSHPIYYPDSFYRYIHLMDGYEYRNGRNPPFGEGQDYLRGRELPALEYRNSDFHYSGDLLLPGSKSLQHNELEEDELSRRFHLE